MMELKKVEAASDGTGVYVTMDAGPYSFIVQDDEVVCHALKAVTHTNVTARDARVAFSSMTRMFVVFLPYHEPKHKGDPGDTMARCECSPWGLCPRHSAFTYAQTGARHLK